MSQTMHTKDWVELGTRVIRNIPQKSSAEGAVVAAGTAAMATPNEKVQLGGMIIMGLFSLWKTFTNGNKD
jgi:hypothetical protein